MNALSTAAAGLLNALQHRALAARERRRWHLLVVILRILLAFAIVPAGLKKLVYGRFTELSNSGPFHNFLDAFYDTGAFYVFVGAMQLLTALALFSQRFATLGALMLLPILTTILVFCWSTGVPFTASVVTLMWLGNVGLVLWDVPKWRGVLAADATPLPPPSLPAPQVDEVLWGRCGLAIYATYLAVCAITGEIYRPRGAEWDNPAFYVFPALAAFPVVTWLLDRRRFKQRREAPETH